MAIGPITVRDKRNLGVTLFNLGRAQEALDAFDVALGTAPDDGLSWAYRGRTLVHLKRWAPAAASLQRALELGVEMPGVRTDLAIALGKSGRYEASEEMFERVLAESPADVEALYEYGVMLMSRGEPRRAEALFQRAIGVAPSHAEALYSLATALAAQSRPAQAMDALGRAVALDSPLRDRARTDPLLAPLRDLDGFRRVAGEPPFHK
jgi:tetratricopeptide (TPR) repeat protein